VKALTVKQLWAWAICFAGKRIENRLWRPAPDYRGPLLIHAAKGCTEAEFMASLTFIEERDLPARVALPSYPDFPRGALVAKCELVDTRWTDVHGHQRPGKYPARAARERCMLCGAPPIGGNMMLPAFACPKADPWAERGALALVLAHVQVFKDPIPYKGQLGLYDVPDDVIEKAEVLP